MYNPCFDCLIRHGHSYTEDCDTICQYANALSKFKPFGSIEKVMEAADTKSIIGTWEDYSTTMMVCSICGKHVAKHKYKFCPECGNRMMSKNKLKSDKIQDWEQLTFFPSHAHGEKDTE